MLIKKAAALAAGIAIALPAGAARALLQNGDFDTDVIPWADPFPNAETIVTWSETDAEEPSASGSLQLQTNLPGNTNDGPISECIVSGPGAYSLSARAFVASSAGQQATGYLRIQFYDTPTCSGDPFADEILFTTQLDAWELLEIEAEAPAGTESVRARVTLGSTPDEVPDVARFDQIVLVPEPDGAAGAAAAGLALAVLSSGARRSPRPRRRAAPAPPRAAGPPAPSGSG
jgi:hypothetical protein